MADVNSSVDQSVRPATLKLKPVIKSGAVGAAKLPAMPGAAPKLPPKPEAVAPAPASDASSLDQLKSVTQNLKSITAQIPQQAILHKTGIIADPGLTEAQMAAAKARTSRISLSDAMGVAPVSSEAAPIKTIRIKRPADVAGGEEAETDANVTQRKTLKISRPGGAVRPGGKLGLKKPDASADGEVADIPDMSAESSFVPANGRLAAAAGQAQGGDVVKDVSKGVAVMSLIVQIAACVAMGLLCYKFWVDIYKTSPF